MLSIWKRELQSYFYTPVGYVFMGVFLTLSGIMFYMQNLSPRSSDVLVFLGQLGYQWMLLSPVLTMRLLAEERRQKTDQLLLTSPVSLKAIVAGKYLAAVTVLVATVACTLVYVLVIALYGKVYPGELAVGYLGFILKGCAFLALDLYISGCAQNQVTSALCAFGVNLLFWVVDMLAGAVPYAWAADALSFISLYRRSEPFAMGQLSYASVAFYLLFILFFLAAAVHRLDARRWKEG